MQIRQFKTRKIEIDAAVERVQQMRVNRGLSMRLFKKATIVEGARLSEDTIKRVLGKAA